MLLESEDTFLMYSIPWLLVFYGYPKWISGDTSYYQKYTTFPGNISLVVLLRCILNCTTCFSVIYETYFTEPLQEPKPNKVASQVGK